VAVLTTARVVDIDGVVACCAVELKFHAARPLEVQAVFPPKEDGPNVWTFSRDLLAIGLDAPSGLGDVRFEPAGEHVLMRISSIDGAASIRLPKATVANFVEDMLLLVPPGEEVLDFDEELTKFLDGAR
jgi:hypothetical protein